MSLLTLRNNIFRFVPGLSSDIVDSSIQTAYQQLGLLEWNRLDMTRGVNTVAPYSTGYITVSAGGTVTGVGATFSAAMVGRWLRVYYSDAFFEILTVTPPSTLTLRNWPGNVLSTNQSFTIFANIYPVDTAMKVVYSVAYQTDLDKKSQTFFNQRDPSRTTTGTPVWWAYAGFNVSGYPYIEIYPVPNQVYPLRVYGKAAAVALGLNDVPYLPEDLIEARALLDCFRIKQSLFPNEGWEQRVTLQAEFYKGVFEAAVTEDKQLESHREKVKDYMGSYDNYPQSDSFWASHDVE